MTTTHAPDPYRPTPLEMFIDVLRAQDHDDPPGNVLPDGWRSIISGVRAALPYMPAIFTVAGLFDSLDGPISKAIKNAASAMSIDNDTFPVGTADLEARYFVGVLVGLTLAPVLVPRTTGGPVGPCRRRDVEHIDHRGRTRRTSRPSRSAGPLRLSLEDSESPNK